jgi:hypothetical protein
MEAGHASHLDVDQVAEDEEIELRQALASRRAWTSSTQPQPEQVVTIVGAPRSGTSHLFNLMAYSGEFAFMSSVSCWAWPAYGLRHSRRQLFSRRPADEIFSCDSKTLRLDERLIVPSEAEDVLQRSLPVYTHLRGHTYLMHSTRSTIRTCSHVPPQITCVTSLVPAS